MELFLDFIQILYTIEHYFLLHLKNNITEVENKCQLGKGAIGYKKDDYVLISDCFEVKDKYIIGKKNRVNAE